MILLEDIIKSALVTFELDEITIGDTLRIIASLKNRGETVDFDSESAIREYLSDNGSFILDDSAIELSDFDTISCLDDLLGYTTPDSALLDVLTSMDKAEFAIPEGDE